MYRGMIMGLGKLKVLALSNSIYYTSCMNNSQVQQIINLYKVEYLSAREIAERLGLTLRSVYYHLGRAGIERRSAHEYNMMRFEKKLLSFQIKKQRSLAEENLRIIAISLYWAEGFQSEKAHTVDFANSNPHMISIFVLYLRTICQVDPDRLRCYLYCYENQNIPQIISFWSEITGIPKTQFTKPYVRSDYRLDKINKMKYGLLHVRYSDKKLLLEIKNQIRALAEEIVGGYQSGQMGQTVKRQHS